MEYRRAPAYGLPPMHRRAENRTPCREYLEPRFIAFFKQWGTRVMAHDPDRLLVFALLMLAFTIKQFIADFPLQTDWMARGKERAEGNLPPLAVHAGIHGLLSTIIAVFAVPALWWLGLVDFIVHFTIDFGKAAISRRTQWKPGDAAFWTLFGFDQMLHHLTGLALGMALVLARV
jgi:Protein of unknown function (DUF3307)